MLKQSLLFALLTTFRGTGAWPFHLESRAVSPGIWPSQSYVTENFTAPNLNITRSGETAPGYLFITPAGNGTSSAAPVIITDSNELIWRGPAEGWTYNGFRVQNIKNESYLTYWRGNSTATFGHGYGSIHVINSSYHEIYTICPPGLDLVTPNHIIYSCYLDQHEQLITDRGTVIATAYNVTPADLSSVGGPKDGWIFDSLFYEVDLKTQEVLFRWRSLDHLPRIPLNASKYPLVLDNVTCGSSDILPWDYFHINSVQALSDGYLVNSRHLYSTYKVSNNGSIDWHLSGYDGGDFKLGPGVFFSWQHDPRIANATESSLELTYFNNDNSEALNGTNSTTGLSLHVDLPSRTVTLNRKLINPAELIFADSQGSYQPLGGGHALIGYGQIAKTREFNASNHVVYEAQYGYSTADSAVASYRSYRQEWTGQPSNPPKIVAHCYGDATELFASWNGATNYDSWIIYAGTSVNNLSRADTIPKANFETAHTLSSSYGFVLAEAMIGNKSLANSTVISTDC